MKTRTAKGQMQESEREAALHRLYSDVSGVAGLGSSRMLHREARKAGLRVSKAEVERFLESYAAHTLFRRRRRPHIPIFAAGLNHLWQADLGFYPPYNRYNTFLLWSLNYYHCS